MASTPRARSRRRSRRALTLAALACAALAAVAGAYPVAGLRIWTVAGGGGACASATCGDGGPATAASFQLPRAIAVDGKGDLFIADTGDNRVREVTATGKIITVAGTGAKCANPTALTNACGDGGPATSATLFRPIGVALDAKGDVFIGDAGDNRVREVTADGKIRTIAGTGERCANPTAAAHACGDGGPATNATLFEPTNLAIDGKGDVFVADTGDNRVREVESGGKIATLAGDGEQCLVAATTAGACGDGGSATSASLFEPTGVAVDSHGDVFISDNSPWACPPHEVCLLPSSPDAGNRVREVSRGLITTVAGTGAECTPHTDPCGDGGPAIEADFTGPSSIAVDGAGDLFIADAGDNRIREVSATGTMNTIAGSGSGCTTTFSPCGDGGAASDAQLEFPLGLAIGSDGQVFVSDTYDYRIRWLTGPVTGPPGSRGAPGRRGAKGPPAKLALTAYSATVGRSEVTVHYALDLPAKLVLIVKPPHRKAVTVARASARAGHGELSWNRKLAGKRAKAGAYQLTIVAALGAQRAASSLTVRL
jgi:hypothetical protein